MAGLAEAHGGRVPDDLTPPSASVGGVLVEDCPCGSGEEYAACCGPLHWGAAAAPTAEALMRSRYAAFVKGDGDYLFRTWHPRTRPDDVTIDPGLTWTGLDILAVVGGGEHDDDGEVAFAAHWRTTNRRQGVLEERSRFVRRAGRWVYLDGEHR